jgi:spermidine synthase
VDGHHPRVAIAAFIALAVSSVAVLALKPARARELHVEHTPFQTIKVVEADGRRCLRFGDGRRELNQSCRSLEHPERVELEYARAVVALSLSLEPFPQRVLVIGLGGASIPNALIDAHPQVLIDAVELDPAVISVAEKYFGFITTDRVHAIPGDGAAFIERRAGEGAHYDLVILDAFDEHGIPPELFTRALLERIRELHGTDGVFVANTFAASSANEAALVREVFASSMRIDVGRNRLLVGGRTRPVRSSRALDRIGATEKWLRSWRVNAP